MVAGRKARMPISEKAAILKENGINVYQWIEAGKSEHYPLPTLVFAGDDNEGQKAVKIMQENGLYVGVLRREWVYNGRVECDQIVWELVG